MGTNILWDKEMKRKGVKQINPMLRESLILKRYYYYAQLLFTNIPEVVSYICFLPTYSIYPLLAWFKTEQRN